MAIIDPEGLFSGERLAACSDLAQLYWPRLFLAANSCGRIELSYKSLVSRVFGNFSELPESSKLWEIFREYDANYLAILYQTEGGTWWCQFSTSEKFLPKYKKTRDNLSPAPPAELMKLHFDGYIAWKKSKSFQNQSFQKVSPSFNSEGTGIGVGVGTGVGVKQKPSRKKSATEVDPRTSEFKDVFFQYYNFKNKVVAPWDGREGKALMIWLAANPTITLEQWKDILRNRARSPIGHGKRLSAWIELATSWLHEQADEWGKPLTGDKKKNGRVEQNQSALETAARNFIERTENPNSHGEAGGDDFLPGGGGESEVSGTHGGTTLEGEP